jgi:ribosome biogenesis GTPase
MRELGLLGAGDAVDRRFEDIHDLAAGCRYADCTHTQEPCCAVLAAIAAGELTEKHYQNYLKLRKESDHYAASYAVRRKKERAFGRFIKSVKKQRKAWGRPVE